MILEFVFCLLLDTWAAVDRRYWRNLFILLFVVFVTAALTGCATPDEKARTLLDRLEFDADEYGSFEVSGDVDLSGNPFFGATVHLKLEKFKDKPSQIEDVAP